MPCSTWTCFLKTDTKWMTLFPCRACNAPANDPQIIFTKLVVYLMSWWQSYRMCKSWMNRTQLLSNFAQCSLGQRALNRLQMCSSDPRERTFIIYAIDTTILWTIPVFWVTAEAMKLTAMTQENTVSTTDTILAEFVRRNTAQLGHNIIRTD